MFFAVSFPDNIAPRSHAPAWEREKKLKISFFLTDNIISFIIRIAIKVLFREKNIF